MSGVGECPGDKRKSECLQESSSLADEAQGSDIIGDEASMDIAASNGAELGTPLEP